MKKYVLLFLLLTGISSGAHAANAVVSLSSHSALMKFNLWVGGQSFGRSEAGVGVLFNDSNSYMIEGNFHVIDEVGTKLPGLVLGLGSKVWAGIQTFDERVLALGFGGSFNYSFPKAERVFIGVDLYGAPPIVTTGADWMWEWATLIGYKVLQDQADVYLSFRQFASYQNNIVTEYDSSPRLGIKFMF